MTFGNSPKVITSGESGECHLRLKVKIFPKEMFPQFGGINKDAFLCPALTGSISWVMFARNQHGPCLSMWKYSYPALSTVESGELPIPRSK